MRRFAGPPLLLGFLTTAVLLMLGPGLTACSPEPAKVTPSLSQGSSPSTKSSTKTVTTADPARSKAKAVLARMTLRQKAAQVLLLEFSGTTSPGTALEKFLSETPPGGLMLFGKNVKSAEQLTAFDATLQRTPRKGLDGVGLFIAADQEGGAVQRSETAYPSYLPRGKWARSGPWRRPGRRLRGRRRD